MNIRTIQRMQRFEKDMEDPANAGQGEALVRLYMLEALTDLCKWDLPWVSLNAGQEQARYWWNQVMDMQTEHEERIGA